MQRWWRRGAPRTDASDGLGSSRCPTCGRAHPLQADAAFEWFSDDDLQVELKPTSSGAAATRALDAEFGDAIYSGSTADLTSAPRWVPVMVVLASVGVLSALLIFSGDAETNEPMADDVAESTVEPTWARTTAVPTPAPTADPVIEAERAVETLRQQQVVASIWARTLVPASDHVKLLYRTEGSVALVDIGAGTQSLLRLDVPIDLATQGFAYLASARGTWVVDPANLDAVLRLAPEAEIGVLSDPTSSIIVPELGARFIMLSQHDGRIVRPLVEVPSSSEIEIVAGRGGIVSPPTGGSSLINGLGAHPLTAGRVLTANADFLVELRCVALACTAVVRPWPDNIGSDDIETGGDPTGVDVGPNEVELPGALWTATELALAPNGEWLIAARDDPNAWELYDLRSGVAEAVVLDVEPSPQPATAIVWAPDSSYFVFFSNGAVVLGAPETPNARAKIPLQFPPVSAIESSEMIIIDR